MRNMTTRWLACFALLVMAGTATVTGKTPASDRDLGDMRGRGQCGYSDCGDVGPCGSSSGGISCDSNCKGSGVKTTSAADNDGLGGDQGSGTKALQGVPYCETHQQQYCLPVPCSTCVGNGAQWSCGVSNYGSSWSDGEHQECCTCS